MDAYNKILLHYIHKFSHLRTDRGPKWTALTQKRAPHKPFLLLSVIDLFAQGEIDDNLVEWSPELVGLFAGYWSRIIPAIHRGYIHYPFFYMKSEGFWHLQPQPGQEKVLDATRQISSGKQLRDMVLGAKLDDELYTLLRQPESRETLRKTLIETYFASEIQTAIAYQGVINLEVFQYSQALLDKACQQIKDETHEGETYQLAVRDQGFRRAIVKIYDHRCAFCGLRMLTPDGHTAVDAAHIIPWNVTQNDDLHNGMALCRLCHWTFDEGLAGVSLHYRIMLSGAIRSMENLPGHLSTLDGRTIIGPHDDSLWPDPDSIKWHQYHIYRRV